VAAALDGGHRTSNPSEDQMTRTSGRPAGGGGRFIIFGRLRPSRPPQAFQVVGSLLVVFLLAFTSIVPAARAIDASLDPSPSATPGPSADPSAPPAPSATAEPTASLTPDPTPDPTAVPSASLDPGASPSPGPAPTDSPPPDPTAVPTDSPPSDPTPAPTTAPLGLHVDHAWVDTVDTRTAAIEPGALDGAATGFDRGRQYIVRFRVVNDAPGPAIIDPVVEFGRGVIPSTWVVLPAVDPVRGLPYYSASNVRRGEPPGVTSIAIGDLRLATSPAAAALPATGVAHAGVNPGPRIVLQAGEFTELSFTIRATADADWLATYTVRLANGVAPIAGEGVATLTMRDSPPVILSPGQRFGIDVPQPISAGPSRASVTGRAGSGLVAPLITLGPTSGSPHGSYSLTTDACAACHSTHTAPSITLIARPAPQSNICFTCHDGTGASSNIAAQYSDPTVPANNASTGSYYAHPATTLSSHASDRDPNEFAGRLDRHAACADCHNPHVADGSLATETTGGWLASGALKGASGVAVVNGAAGTTPSLTWASTSEFEYELCFKCHSGFTQLKPQTAGPSTWALDKSVELNPNNLSYHPVEAPGTNTTVEMQASLDGSSPYKLWNFSTGSTVRCVNCHGDSRLATPGSPPVAGARLAPHAVPNRGMLIANLRDRALKGPFELYNASDFALCYVCHEERPFVNLALTAPIDTRFPPHAWHLNRIAAGIGPDGGTVDDDGAGRGNALCAECHFRTHGTTYPVDGQAPTTRLVNFAPDVQPYDGFNPLLVGKLEWNAATATCTLRCHGVNHAAWSY
jgi:predicted CXXCH cytochrome family protein